MNPLFNPSTQNGARRFNSIDLLSPSSENSSAGNHRVFAMIPQTLPIMYPRFPQQTFTTLIDTYNNATNSGFTHSNSGSRTSRQYFTEPTINTSASAAMQSPAGIPQPAVSVSDSEFYAPRPYNTRRSTLGRQCTRPLTRSSTLKQRQTATSTALRSPANSNKSKRDGPRPTKKRKLESKPEPKEEPNSDEKCCICLEQPLVKDLAKVNGCEHRFCFGCIDTWADHENTCPLCKTRFTQIERCSESKDNKTTRSSVKKVKFRDQRTDSGRSIQHLLANLDTGSTITNLETGSMGAALTHLFLHGFNNPNGSFVSFGHGFRPRTRSRTNWASTNYRPSEFNSNPNPANSSNNNRTGAANRNVLDILNPHSQQSFGQNSNTNRTTASDPIHLDIDESIFDAETTSNRPSSSASGDVRFLTDTEIDLNDIIDTEDLDESLNFVQRVRDLSRDRNRVFERFQNNDRNSAYNVDAGDSPENALEIYDSDQDDMDVVEVVGGQSG